MTRRHPALGQRLPEFDGFGLAVALAEQFGFEQIEIAKLLAAASVA